MENSLPAFFDFFCIVTAIILILTPIGSAFTQTWEQLFVVRLLLGLGMGLKGSTVPVFCAENSDFRIRGSLTMSWQLWTGKNASHYIRNF